MQKFRKLSLLLGANERTRATLLLIMVLITSFIDVLSIASIFPFVAVITNPAVIETNSVLNVMFKISNRFGIESSQDFIFFLGIIVFVIIVTSLAFKSFTIYAQVKFVRKLEYTISKRLIEGYLNQPYSWFLSRNSSELTKIILSEVSQVVGSGISSSIQLISKVILVTILIALLIVVNPKVIIIIGLILGASYLFVFKLVNNFLNKIGKERLLNNKLRYKTITEVFGAIKEVKFAGLEKIFANLFSNTNKIFIGNKAYLEIVSQLPRFILEAIAFGGIMLGILYGMTQVQNFNDILPIISLYIFAGYRLMPAFQEIFAASAQLTFTEPVIDKLTSEINNLKSHYKDKDKNVLKFDNEIRLNHVHYNYPNTSRVALNDIDLTISAKTTVGLIGPTGCGKTTTVDIILGLLKPQKGTLEIDGKVICEKNLRAWQKLIGYVPQNIFLTDDTIEANIAFGVEPKNINQDMVKKVSKISNIHQFIIEELPEQYQTIIGERGIRLSGGQRQRIGIARALYHNPKVLILDEATSALDNKTEEVVMEAINKLSNQLTIILIAHRLNTVKNCKIVYKLDKGKIFGKDING